MEKQEDKYRTNIEPAEPDSSLKRDDGFVNMKLHWLINEDKMGSECGVLGYTIFPPGESEHAPHIHDNAEEYIIIEEGKGVYFCGDEKYEVKPGDVLFTPKGENHSIKNASETEPLKIFFVYCGGGASLEKAGYTPV